MIYYRVCDNWVSAWQLQTTDLAPHFTPVMLQLGEFKPKCTMIESSNPLSLGQSRHIVATAHRRMLLFAALEGQSLFSPPGDFSQKSPGKCLRKNPDFSLLHPCSLSTTSCCPAATSTHFSGLPAAAKLPQILSQFSSRLFRPCLDSQLHMILYSSTESQRKIQKVQCFGTLRVFYNKQSFSGLLVFLPQGYKNQNRFP